MISDKLFIIFCTSFVEHPLSNTVIILFRFNFIIRSTFQCVNIYINIFINKLSDRNIDKPSREEFY